MSGQEPFEHLSPSERRLLEHLELVRADEPERGVSIARAVVRRARIQRALRDPLHVIAVIAAAVGHGLAGLFGASRPERHS